MWGTLIVEEVLKKPGASWTGGSRIGPRLGFGVTQEHALQKALNSTVQYFKQKSLLYWLVLVEL